MQIVSVAQPAGGKASFTLFSGPKLRGIHVDHQLAVLADGHCLIFAAALQGAVLIVTEELGVLAVPAVLVNAAPQGHITSVGATVRLLQEYFRLGRSAQLDGIHWVELKAGGVPLTGEKGVLPDGCKPNIVRPIRQTHMDIGSDAFRFVKGQNALIIRVEYF